MNLYLAPERRTDTPRKVIRALFLWRWSALLFFLLFFGFVMLIGYVWPPIYQSEAALLVKPGRQNQPAGVTDPAAQARLDFSSEDVISEIEIMLSRPVIEQVVDRLIADMGPPKPPKGFARFKEKLQDSAKKLGLLPVVEEREALITHFSKKFQVELVPASNVLSIKYNHQNKARAQRAINYLLESYLDRHTLIHSDTGALEFFTEQSSTFREQLGELQQRITTFRLEHDGGDLTFQRELILTELSQAESLLLALDEITNGEAELLTGTSVVDDADIQYYNRVLLDLKLDREQTLQNYAPGTKEVEAIDDRIEAAREDLTAQLDAKRSFFRRRVSTLREKLQQIETDRSTYEDLLAERSRIQTLFNQYQTKVEEERISNAMDADKIVGLRVLEWASLPTKPAFPNRFLLAILGIMMGVPGAIAVALLRGYFHGRVSTVQDVEEELGTPVLDSVRRLPRRAMRKGMPPALLGSARVVLMTLERAGIQALHVASATPREGAATYAAALATACIQDSNRKVVFAYTSSINTDRLDHERLEVMDLRDQSLEEQRHALSEARKRCDFLVLTGSPLAGSGHGGFYASMADASLFVVSGRGIHLEVARRALRVLNRFSPMVIGAILTQRRDPIPRLLYNRI